MYMALPARENPEASAKRSDEVGTHLFRKNLSNPLYFAKNKVIEFTLMAPGWD